MEKKTVDAALEGFSIASNNSARIFWNPRKRSGDRLVTRAEFEGLGAAITALTTQVTALTTRMDNLVAYNNGNQRGGRREEHNRRPRGGVNQAGDSSSSEEEESVDYDDDHQNRQDYRVKADTLCSTELYELRSSWTGRSTMIGFLTLWKCLKASRLRW